MPYTWLWRVRAETSPSIAPKTTSMLPGPAAMIPKIKSTIAQAREPTYFAPIMHIMPMIIPTMPEPMFPRAVNGEKAKRGELKTERKPKRASSMPPISTKM